LYVVPFTSTRPVCGEPVTAFIDSRNLDTGPRATVTTTSGPAVPGTAATTGSVWLRLVDDLLHSHGLARLPKLGCRVRDAQAHDVTRLDGRRRVARSVVLVVVDSSVVVVSLEESVAATLATVACLESPPRVSGERR